jgi:hypothetical protein
MHQNHYACHYIKHNRFACSITKASLLHHQLYKLSLLLLLVDIAKIVDSDFLLNLSIAGLSNKLGLGLSLALCLTTSLFFSHDHNST